MPDEDPPDEPGRRRRGLQIVRHVEQMYLKQVSEAVEGRTYASLVRAVQNMLGKLDAVYEQSDMARGIVRDAMYHAALGLQDGKYDPQYRNPNRARRDAVDPRRHLNSWVYRTAINYFKSLRRKLDASRRAENKASHDPGFAYGSVNTETPESALIRRQAEESDARFAGEAQKILEHIEPENIRLVLEVWIELIIEEHRPIYLTIEKRLHNRLQINANYAKQLVRRGKLRVQECLQRMRNPQVPQELHFVIMMRYATTGELLEPPWTLLERIAEEVQMRVEFDPNLRGIIEDFLAPKIVGTKVSATIIKSILIKIDRLSSSDGSRARAQSKRG